MNFTTKICKTSQIVFAIFLIFFAIRLFLYHYHLVIFPYSAMLREGAMMTSTDALVKGLNPYAMALQPQYVNEYGIIYPLLVWPLAKIFGTTILIHRIVTAISILISCLLIFLVLVRMRIPILLNIWAILMLYSSLLYPGTSTPCIDPAATGMFLFLVTIFVPWFCRYSYKSLIISMLCGILAFYTKPYLVLGIPIIGSYLFLFVSKEKGLFYTFLWLLLTLLSVILVNQTLPAYFDNCFFVSANMGPSWESMDRLYLQIHLYTGLHQWVLLLMAVFILGFTFEFFLRNPIDRILKNIRQFFLNIRINAFKEPLIKLNFPLVVYAGLCSAFVLYMSLGRHGGAMLWYFFQLLSPFFLITAVWLFSRHLLWPIWCVLFLILTLHTMTIDQGDKWFDKDLLGWPQLSQLVSQHQHILNTPLIAPLLIEQHKEVYDNGQAEYFLSGGQRNYWMKGVFKEDQQVYLQQMIFFTNIKLMVENKEYDLILLQPSLLPMGVADDIKEYYKYEGQLLVYAPQDRRPYAVTVWRPL